MRKLYQSVEQDDTSDAAARYSDSDWRGHSPEVDASCGVYGVMGESKREREGGKRERSIYFVLLRPEQERE